MLKNLSVELSTDMNLAIIVHSEGVKIVTNERTDPQTRVIHRQTEKHTDERTEKTNRQMNKYLSFSTSTYF